MHRVYLFLFFLLSLAISQNIKKDIRVAVLGFEDNTKNTYSRNSITVGDYVLDELLSQIFKTGEVKIIERERLATIMNEQNFQISGVVTSQSAVEIGNLLGIDYAIFGSINKATTEQKKSGTKLGDYGINVNKSIARVSISLKMVDIQSGEIVFMENFTKKVEDKTVGLADYGHNINFSNSKEFDKSLLGKAVRGAIKKIVNKVVKYIQAIPWKGRISKVSGDNIYINAGEKHGITIDMLIEVFREGEEIIDPSSGKILAVEKFSVGILKVVNNNIGEGVASTCNVVNGSSFNENDLIQLLPISKGVTTGTVPIYRYYHKKNKDHFYTKNPSVKSTYTPQGIEFYAFER